MLRKIPANTKNYFVDYGGNCHHWQRYAGILIAFHKAVHTCRKEHDLMLV
jgi:hypothetical protein